MSRILLAILVLVAVAAPRAYAAGEHDTLGKGLPVGAKFPPSLTVADQNDQHRDFKSLARRRGLIILFSRSLDW